MADTFNNPELTERQGFVYFIGPRRGPVKIGWAFNPAKRLGQLQTASPVKLYIIAAFPGTQKQESALHARHYAGRLEGEWFKRTPELLRDISNCQTRPIRLPQKPSRKRPPRQPNPENAARAFDAGARYFESFYTLPPQGDA